MSDNMKNVQNLDESGDEDMLGNGAEVVFQGGANGSQGEPSHKIPRTRREGQRGDGEQGGPENAARESAYPEPPPGLSGARPSNPESGEISLNVLLQAIQRGEEGNAQRHQELRKDLGKMDRELRTVKETAAKALVTSTEAHKEIQSLKERLEKVERGEYSGSSTTSNASTFSGGAKAQEGYGNRGNAAQPTLPRSALLGGQTGGEFIVGGFPAWSRKQQILDWGASHVLPALSDELRTQVQDTSAPGKRGSILICQLKPLESVDETRRMMFRAVKELNLAKVRIPTNTEDETVLWSGPSKPAYVRQQDMLVTDALNVARKLFDEKRLDYDYPKQRVFADDRLIAARAPDSDKLDFRVATLEQLLPGFHVGKLEEARQQVKREREEKRAKQ